MNDLTVYNQVKDQMKTGDLLQWYTKGIIAYIIRWKTNSPVNHSSLVIRLSEYEGMEDRRWTTEEMAHGAVLHLLSDRLENHDGHCWWLPLDESWSDEKRKKVGEWALEKIGTPYDYKSIVEQLIGHVSTDARQLFCSEYCYMAWGYEGTAPNPGDLFKLGIFKRCVQLV